MRPGADAATLGALRKLPGATLLPVDVTDRDALAAGLQGHRAEALISCIASRGGGREDSWRVDYRGNANLLRWALASGVRHFSLLSAICVQKPRLEFQRAKARFETELAASGISYSVLRPTAYFKSLCGQVGRVRAGRPYLLFGDGRLTACKPIAEGDLAALLLRSLEEPALQGRVLPVGGPGPALTPLDQGRLLSRLAGRPLRTRSLPPALFTGAAGLLDLGARLHRPLADKAEFARIGHYYATESMLLWDPARGCYDADATPEYGHATLEDCYRELLAGRAAQSQALGEHALFSRRRR